MANSRIGETLWDEWDDNEYFSVIPGATVFVTPEHVDIENDVVRMALASKIQRYGYTDSLGQAFSLLERSVYVHGYVGFVDGDTILTVCDEDGETFYGDVVDQVVPATWVEVPI